MLDPEERCSTLNRNLFAGESRNGPSILVMDTFALAIGLRAAERILVVAVGGLAIYLGYRLFLSIPERDRSSGKLELPGGISIFLTRIGPGAFFALFGSVVIALSFQYGVTVSEPVNIDPSQESLSAGDTASERRYSGIVPRSHDHDPLEIDAERANVSLVITDLNRGFRLLSPHISPTERIDIERANAQAKVRLLASVWDSDAWGDITVFHDWIRSGESEPVPDEIAVPVNLFRS